jgi:hypothetical protein
MWLSDIEISCLAETQKIDKEDCWNGLNGRVPVKPRVKVPTHSHSPKIWQGTDGGFNVVKDYTWVTQQFILRPQVITYLQKDVDDEVIGQDLHIQWR